MKNIDSVGHVSGKSVYVDDVSLQKDTLFALVYGSPIPHGVLTSIDYTAALQLEGIYTIFTYKDIPGENQIGGIIKDEPFLVEKDIHFRGQPIAIIIGESEFLCRKARKLIKISYEEKPVITNPRVAAQQNLLLHPPRTFQLGNVNETWEKCDVIVEGTTESGGQEHLYIETQGAYAFPIENNSLKIISSTQGPTAVQRTVAQVLNIPMHKIEVEVRRLGGGFGGKEDQATIWGCVVGLASYLIKKPVKIILHRLDDMYMTGKRHPYSSDFKIGLSKDGKILAYEVTFFQDAGAHADLSPAVLGRTLSHATNTYFIPNVKAVAHPCKTNLPPNTAFRGFGGPQGMFVIESAIVKAAEAMKKNPYEIQEKNLLQDQNSFPYSQIATKPTARLTWKKLHEITNFENVKREIEEFNSKNKLYKKGFSVMPICFGISFNKTSMNQAGALVNVYHDGSIGVSTGAVEMGQGVNTRILQVPVKVFSIDPDLVKMETTNTTRVINTSPSAASSTADLNGKATFSACSQILLRLIDVIKDMKGCHTSKSVYFKDGKVVINDKITDLTWKEVINEAFSRRVNLSAQGYYATPNINFDMEKEKGHPFAYHVYGTALFEVTVDCLRGIYTFDRVTLVHDYGKSWNKYIDIGQTEGGLVQGIGWFTSEEVVYDESGILRSNSLSTYKIPDIQAVPKIIDIHFLENSESDYGLFKSKAIGEPPLLYGMGAYFAIQNAIQNFNPDYKLTFNAPMTPEKVLFSLYNT